MEHRFGTKRTKSEEGEKPKPIDSEKSKWSVPYSCTTPKVTKVFCAQSQSQSQCVSQRAKAEDEQQGQEQHTVKEHKDARQGSEFGRDTPSSSSIPWVSSEQLASPLGGFSTGVTTLSSGQGFKRTFYKRKLPSPPSTAFSSPEGRQLFAEALTNGHMGGFFKLMEQFR